MFMNIEPSRLSKSIIVTMMLKYFNMLPLDKTYIAKHPKKVEYKMQPDEVNNVMSTHDDVIIKTMVMNAYRHITYKIN